MLIIENRRNYFNIACDPKPITFVKGDAVIVSPVSYPCERYQGIINRKTANGFSVRVTVAGMTFDETYSAKEISK